MNERSLPDTSQWEDDLRARKLLLESSRNSTTDLLKNLNKREEELKDLVFWKKSPDKVVSIFKRAKENSAMKDLPVIENEVEDISKYVASNTNTKAEGAEFFGDITQINSEFVKQQVETEKMLNDMVAKLRNSIVQLKEARNSYENGAVQIQTIERLQKETADQSTTIQKLQNQLSSLTKEKDEFIQKIDQWRQELIKKDNMIIFNQKREEALVKKLRYRIKELQLNREYFLQTVDQVLEMYIKGEKSLPDFENQFKKCKKQYELPTNSNQETIDLSEFYGTLTQIHESIILESIKLMDKKDDAYLKHIQSKLKEIKESPFAATSSTSQPPTPRLVSQSSQFFNKEALEKIANVNTKQSDALKQKLERDLSTKEIGIQTIASAEQLQQDEPRSSQMSPRTTIRSFSNVNSRASTPPSRKVHTPTMLHAAAPELIKLVPLRESTLRAHSEQVYKVDDDVQSAVDSVKSGSITKEEMDTLLKLAIEPIKARASSVANSPSLDVDPEIKTKVLCGYLQKLTSITINSLQLRGEKDEFCVKAIRKVHSKCERMLNAVDPVKKNINALYNRIKKNARQLKTINQQLRESVQSFAVEMKNLTLTQPEHRDIEIGTEGLFHSFLTDGDKQILCKYIEMSFSKNYSKQSYKISDDLSLVIKNHIAFEDESGNSIDDNKVVSEVLKYLIASGHQFPSDALTIPSSTTNGKTVTLNEENQDIQPWNAESKPKNNDSVHKPKNRKTYKPLIITLSHRKIFPIQKDWAPAPEGVAKKWQLVRDAILNSRVKYLSKVLHQASREATPSTKIAGVYNFPPSSTNAAQQNLHRIDASVYNNLDDAKSEEERLHLHHSLLDGNFDVNRNNNINLDDLNDSSDDSDTSWISMQLGPERSSPDEIPKVTLTSNRAHRHKFNLLEGHIKLNQSHHSSYQSPHHRNATTLPVIPKLPNSILKKPTAQHDQNEFDTMPKTARVISNQPVVVVSNSNIPKTSRPDLYPSRRFGYHHR